MSRAASAGAAAGAAIVAASLFSPPAFASNPPESIDVDREDAPITRGELGFDGGAPASDYAVGAELGALERPIELRDGHVVSDPVARRETFAAGASLAVGDSAVVDVRAAFAHQIGARLEGFGDDTPLARWVPLDTRLGVRLRAAAIGRTQLFARAEETIPTGDQHNFAGEAGFATALGLIARVELPAHAVVAAAVGVRLRGKESAVAGETVGDEVTGSLGVALPLPAFDPLWCSDQVLATAELDAIRGDSDPDAHGPSPVEARVGVVSRPRPWLELGVRGGVGLDDDIGSPRWRVALTAAWRGAAAGATKSAAPRASPPDADGEDDDDVSAR